MEMDYRTFEVLIHTPRTVLVAEVGKIEAER